jgi:hypothetical protein
VRAYLRHAGSTHEIRANRVRLEEEIQMTAQMLFPTAEVEYRIQRAKDAFPRGRRRTVRRRRTLHIPQQLRRPVAVA